MILLFCIYIYIYESWISICIPSLVLINVETSHCMVNQMLLTTKLTKMMKKQRECIMYVHVPYLTISG